MKKLLVLSAMFAVFQCIAGSITTSVNSLYNFKECYINHSATAQWFLVSGSGLSSNVIITAPEHFEISTDLNKFYSGTLTIATGATLASTKIFVRFSPNTTGAKTGNVAISSAGSADKNIGVNGTGTNFTSLSAYYPTTANTGAALKTSLYDKIKGHTSVSYSQLWNAYYTTDVQPNGKVWDVYSTSINVTPPYEFTFGAPHQDNGSGGTNEGEKYNREHTFPQSWFNDASPMVSDIHHIFPTDKKVNNVRGNNPFGQVSSPTFTSLIGGKLGNNTTTGYSQTVFEPIDEYKGDIARAQLYMITRYDNLISGWTGNGTAGNVLAGNSYPGYKSWYIDLLISWHNLDPVSDKEIKRNNAIYAIQNNRNPFIDSPQYAQKIWGGALPSEPAVIASNLSISNNTGTSFGLTFKSGDGFRRLIVVRPSSVSAVHPTDLIHYNANNNISLAAVTGAQNYVVYNGTSSSVNVTGLTQGVNYTINVYEYNGWYNTTNYSTTSFASIATAPASVQWGTLTATKETDKNITLNWNTLSETNNSLFEVERSLNGGPFKLIATKTPVGNSTTVQNYSVADDTLRTSTANDITSLTYRIKQTGVSADFSYSNTALISNVIVIPDTIIWGNLNASLQADSHAVVLTWSTLKELNNARFLVQKDKSGSGFQTISTILSKGNSNNTQNYSFTDTANTGLSTVVYRIQQQCINGTVSYSNQQTVNFPPPPSWIPDSVSISGFEALLDSTGLINLNWVVNYEGRAGTFDLLRSINNKPYYVIRSYAGYEHNTAVTLKHNDDTLQKNNTISKLVYQLRYTGENSSYIMSTDTQMIVVDRTGLFETRNYFQGNIYPQPFTNKLHIILPEPDNGKYVIVFTDLLGRQVKTIEQEAVQGTILIDNIQHLNTGIYLLKIMHENDIWYTKVVKQ